MAGIHDLRRFVEAQAGVHECALAELRGGRKTSHWMWFVFPQVAGLGASPMSRRYAIGSVAEAQAYLAHPLLGDRLRTCTAAVLGHPGRSASAIFGSPDDVKFRSCMTLFAEIAPAETSPGETAPADTVFAEALDLFFDGERDPLTLATLRGG